MIESIHYTNEWTRRQIGSIQLRHDRRQENKNSRTNQNTKTTLAQILPTNSKSYRHSNHKKNKTFLDKYLKHFSISNL